MAQTSPRVTLETVEPAARFSPRGSFANPFCNKGPNPRSPLKASVVRRSFCFWSSGPGIVPLLTSHNQNLIRSFAVDIDSQAIQLSSGGRANFLHMCFAVPGEEYKVDPALASAMRRIFILHADHEQSASTSTVRLAGSSGANPYACISAGIASLWGPVHGGANEAVLTMWKEIGSVERMPEYIKRAKDKNDPFRFTGFGYRVYKNYDPRAVIMQKACHEALETVGRHYRDAPILKVALELEHIALSDDYFIENKLGPNIDFYSAIT